MVSSSYLLVILALLVLNKRATAEEGSTGFHGTERDALLSLKKGLNSPFLDSNWTGIMCYMNETVYWHGIGCFNGRVSALILESLGITGEINADAFVNLTELSDISFKNNFLSGNVMEFTNKPKLRKIDLSGNRFHGEIPQSLLYLNSLESLLLHNNNLTGPIPGFNQSNLNTFDVSQNNLSGPIPETITLQSFGLSSYARNEYLCGNPTKLHCNARNQISNQSNSGNSGDGDNGDNNSHLEAILIVVNVIVLVTILCCFIIYYRKYKKLKREMKAANLWPIDEEQDSTIMDTKMERRAPEEEKGKLVFVNNNDNEGRFELDDLLKASAEGLGRGNFGNCYKAMLETGLAVVVKRLIDLKPLSREEFVRHVKAIADQKHQNLLPLLAYYYSKDEKFFLYRFVVHGNVYNRLHGNHVISF